MRRSMPCSLVLAAIYLVAVAKPACASKTAAGRLTGVVLTSKGAGVPSARVFWEAVDGSVPHTLKADSTGHFSVPSVRPGLYELRGEADGMWSEWHHNVLVRPGAEGNVTLRLVRKTPPPKVAAPAPASPPASLSAPHS